MKITWYGTASILLEAEDGRLLFDPFLKALPAGAEPPALAERRRSQFQAQDTILITHGHLDHLSSIQALYQHRPCRICLTKTPHQTLLRQGFPPEKLRLIQPGDLLRFPGMAVKVLRGKHIRYDLGVIRQLLSRSLTREQHIRLMQLARLNRQYPEEHETVFFEVYAEGKRVQLMGSAQLAREEAYPTDADALVLPHQGRSDMDRHNRRIVDALQPKRILLDHYDDAFPPISAPVPVDAFVRELAGAIPTEKLLEGIPVLV